MAKVLQDIVRDQALSYIENNCDQIVLCAGEPADYAAATSDSGSGGNALGESAIGAADVTLADGVTGRKATFASKIINVDVSGTADHIAIVDDTNSNLLLTTTIDPTRSVSAGDETETAAFDLEIEAVS